MMDTACPRGRLAAIPPSKPCFESLMSSLKETLFPDDPFRRFANQPPSRKLLLGLLHFVPFLEWIRCYTWALFRSDLVAGVTIASLAVPQGISYANLANLPPIIGLYSSFVPPVVYALLGSSRELAVGTVAVASLLMSSTLGKVVSSNEQPGLYVRLTLASTFVAGLFQATLGLFRLGIIVDFLSHATIVGFMGGAATVVCLQQLKGILGLRHFTHSTDLISVLRSVITQRHQWRWESVLLGCCFLFFLFVTKYISKRKPTLFWVGAMAPLLSVIMGSLLVYLSRAENHGIQVIGHLKKGLNPLSVPDLAFHSTYLMTVIRTGLVTGLIALAEGIAVGRSFAMMKSYHTDGNKEMIAFGVMNIAGSFTSCYLTSGIFSRTAVNFNAGCKTAVSNIVMAVTIMMTLLFLTPLFHYTPLVVLSAIIITAMIGLINYTAVANLWKVDKFDFVTCIAAYIGVVFGSVELGLIIGVTVSLLRVLLVVARPRTSVLGNVPNSMTYRSIEQYPLSKSVPGILILSIDGPIYFTNTSYLRERMLRWIQQEEDKLKSTEENNLQYVILDMSAVGYIDTSGLSMLEEVQKNAERRGIKIVLANPGSEVMKKLGNSKLLEEMGREWLLLTVADAVEACNFTLQTYTPKSISRHENNV